MVKLIDFGFSVIVQSH